MCLIIFAWDKHSNYKLALTANRDEFYDRPAKPAHFWPETPDLLAGRDLKAGGTWLGITRQGKFAAITNYRDPANIKQEAPSRGELTFNFLKNDITPLKYLEKLSSSAKDYNGFNLLVGNLKELYFYSNVEGEIKALVPGLYGLSNHLLDTPWPKVEMGKQLFQKWMTSPAGNEAQILDLMDNKKLAADAKLPSTDVPLEWERALSAMHIQTEKYGTVSTTSLLVGRDGQVKLVEKTFNNPLGPLQEKEFVFQLDSEEIPI